MNIQNKKARFNYEILEKLEAGIVLQGNEVKSIRSGKVNLAESFITIKNAEAWIHNMHILPYDKSAGVAADPTRIRKLLMHKKEITRLIGKIKEKGLTMVPLQLYFKKNNVKIQVGLGKGKKSHDKRETIKKRELDRELGKILKSR